MAAEAGGGERRVLVLDTGALIARARLDSFPFSEFVTVRDVLDEVRDETTRMYLDALPVKIDVREPDPQSMRADKTGDLRFLSGPDLRVLALQYMVEREIHGGVGHLRTAPKTVRDVSEPVAKPKDADEDVFNAPSSSSAAEGSVAPSSANTVIVEEIEAEELDAPVDTTAQEAAAGATAHDDDGNAQVPQPSAPNRATMPSKPADDDDDDDDDDDGWITPKNVKKVKEQHAKRGYRPVPEKTVRVACATTDYSMQNVILQMGMHLVSVDGMQIRRVKLWKLKCHACFQICADPNAVFCPTCGNQTLVRIPVTVTPGGETQYSNTMSRKIYNLRGTKFSIPAPKGGRQAVKMVMNEDELHAATRRTKKAVDPFDADYDFGGKRTGKQGFYDMSGNEILVGAKTRRNPNEKRATGRRKRKSRR